MFGRNLVYEIRGWVYGNSFLKAVLLPVYVAIRDFIRFIRWTFRHSLNRGGGESKARLLAVYDISIQGFTLGDFLNFHEATLALCEIHEIQRVDIAIVFDRNAPAPIRSVFEQSVNSKNVYAYLTPLIGICQINPRMGALLLLDESEDLTSYVLMNVRRYMVWPTPWQLGASRFLTEIIYREVLFPASAALGRLPELSCQPHLRDWAAEFYSKTCGGRRPVTINIRNNPLWDIHRNSDIDAWAALFNYCAKNYNVIFVILCRREEVDSRLRSLPNVIYAKDHCTTAEQDFSLVCMSDFHMGANSGPLTMAWFNSKPYSMLNTNLTGTVYDQPGFIINVAPGMQRFWFASEDQIIVNAKETAGVLISEFKRLYSAVSK